MSGRAAILLPPLACILAGCVWHEARVSVPPTPPPARGQEASGPTSVLVDSGPVRPAQATPVVRRGPLPQDLRVSAWHMDPSGSILCRAEERITTPLSWWQRFPCDAFVDIVPTDATARADATIICRPVPEADPAALAESARCDGYGHDEAARTPHAR